ncbi:hypothetical protein MNBD_BACTEROID05-530, partial [hydrothermal vent metagenome]
MIMILRGGRQLLESFGSSLVFFGDVIRAVLKGRIRF